MSKVKKLILGLGVAVGMAIAFVVGLVGINQGKPSKVIGSNVNGEQEYVAPKVELNQSKPTTITHAPNEIKVEKGGDSINYSYQPDNNSKDNAKVVAYEYCFGSTRDAMAVDIKSIGDTTGVDISYIYSDTEIDTESIQNSYTRYDVQKINSGNKWKYIYIVVSAQDEVPTEFSHNIEWYYGKAGEVTIANNFDNSTSTLTIVKGAEMQQPTNPTLSNGYNFMGWYLDKNCTTPATFPRITSGLTLYAKFPNLPTDYLAWDSTTSSYCVKRTSLSILSGNLVIPETYNDGTNGLANVTYIAKSVFSLYYNGLTSITLPSTITNIEDYAFQQCLGLTSIDLSGCTSLTNIGSQAFINCYGLTSISLPSSVTSIGSEAFSNCYGLTSITLSSDLISIGSSAFSSCCALAEVYNLSSLNITAGSTDNGGVGQYAKVIYISLDEPSRILTIGNVQYYDDGTNFIALAPTSRDVTSVTLDSKTTAINEYAFRYCNGLTSITLPGSLTSIGERAFYNCSGLTSIDLSGCTSLTSMGFSVFDGCSKLTTIDLSGCISLTSVGRAFSICSRLTSITLPSSLISIDMYAFDGCSGLTSIDLNQCNSLTTIGSNAFDGCSGLTSVTLPSSLTRMGNYAFSGCGGLTSIVIPAGVTKIGYYAFSGCTNLTSITFEDTSTWYYTSSSNYTNGTEIDVTDASANATYFKSTYYDKYWYKI